MKTPTEITPLLAEETGIHIGDGSMNIYKNGAIISIAGHPIDDREFYEKHVRRLYKELFDVNVNLRQWSRAFGFQVSSKDLVQFKNKLGLPLGKKVNISIPEQIKKDLTLYASCVRGVFDTDGTFYLEKKNRKLYPRVQIVNTSKNLISEVCNLLKQLNIPFGTWSYQPLNKNWKETHTVAVRGKQVCVWMNKIGSSNPKHIDKYKKYLCTLGDTFNQGVASPNLVGSTLQ